MCEAKPVNIHTNINRIHQINNKKMYYSLNLCKRNKLSKDEPDVDHLDIGGGGQRLGHADEEGGQHQQRGQVHRHHRLKEEWFEEVGSIDNS